MHPSSILFIIIFTGSILVTATIGTIIIILIKVIKGKPKKNQKEEAEEALLIQEIYHGLSEMEKRVESLETILIETQRK
jgi:phage shock protein B